MPNKEQLLQYIRNVTLSLSWDGGQETVNLVLDNLNMEVNFKVSIYEIANA